MKFLIDKITTTGSVSKLDRFITDAESSVKAALKLCESLEIQVKSYDVNCNTINVSDEGIEIGFSLNHSVVFPDFAYFKLDGAKVIFDITMPIYIE